MEGCAEKVLESVTLKTLHAHAFSRASSQATNVLTDLLARYLFLLAQTCAQYAQHANRTALTPHDALSALAELGIDIEELEDFVHDEARELVRYAPHAPKRAEDLADMHG
jgi:histone H3/H4